MKIFTWIGLPVIAVVGLGFGVQDVVPAWDAKNGDGKTGTFTAKREDCGRRSCSFYGDWVAADGTKGRPDVILYDEPDGMVKGDTIEALDTGARTGVFAKGGGEGTFYLTLGLSLAGLAAAIGFVIFLVRRFTRKREPAAETAAATA